MPGAVERRDSPGEFAGGSTRFGSLAEARWSSLRWLAACRLAVALALTVFLPLHSSVEGAGWLTDPALFSRAALAYLIAALLFLVAIGPLQAHFQLQLLCHTLTDLLALTVLMHAAGGVREGFGVLMVAAVAAAALVSTSRMAASAAAAAALLLLGEAMLSWLHSDGANSGLLMIAGLTGAACFITAMLVNWLAMQLRQQEALARARGEDLHNQLAVTQRVVDELEQGVLVVAPDGRLRAMNPAARLLLDVDADDPQTVSRTPSTPMSPALAAVLDACEQWREAGAPAGEQRELVLPARRDEGRRYEPPAPVPALLRFLATPGGDIVLTLEDLHRVEHRAQQLKLAAMGRLSASIAHEIRNPLGAIRHANALLAERLDDAAQRRLSRIIEDNTLRIDRVISDVLSVSRRERPGDEAIEVAPFLSTFADEFVAQAGVARERIALQIESDRPMRFDPNHLRQVLVNLVGNALRYASDAPGSVVLTWRERASHRLELRVSDDGPGLSAEMQQHVFEPFFTTEARGTGLGLYLARELCEANGAAVRYERGAGAGRGAFVIEPRAGLSE